MSSTLVRANPPAPKQHLLRRLPHRHQSRQPQSNPLLPRHHHHPRHRRLPLIPRPRLPHHPILLQPPRRLPTPPTTTAQPPVTTEAPPPTTEQPPTSQAPPSPGPSSNNPPTTPEPGTSANPNPNPNPNPGTSNGGGNPGTTVQTTVQVTVDPPATPTQQPGAGQSNPSAPQQLTSTVIVPAPEQSLPPTSTRVTWVSDTNVPGLLTGAPETTAESAVRITTTDSKGNVITTIPSSFTSTGLTTSGGNVFTVTRVVHNPSGALDSGSSSGGSSSFFNNKGAVAGVFVVVGLAVVAILAALGFIFFRKRRRQRLDREVTAAAVAASAAAARSPLDEEGDIASSHPTSESYPSTMSAPMQQYNNYATTYGNGGGYDPFALQSDGGAHATGVAAAAGAGAGAYGAYGTDFSDPRYHDAPAGRYHDDGPFHDAHEYVSDGQHRGYDGMEQGGQGYYYDPYYDDDPNQQRHSRQGYPQHSYNDEAYGTYSGGEESVGTPTHERTNPLHITNPSHPPTRQ
ncbi:uncharacterized protein COLE_01690 [Cutaneotrichosporon oleaginosum]|uniref:uncharacterized protein n=1 Tax=Cutaneotrichosporon oleaginosum TaxID=879819 RepID=UPI001325CE4E|nr:hypothetical protein COLE_01690 [Cutaneotrichosporon oleaginosum]